MKKIIKNQGSLPIKIWTDTIEDNALEQASILAKHPALFKQVCLMPDVHAGYGMPIGGVIACRGAVIPNAVGVDQGCGMSAVKTSFRPLENEGVLTKEALRSVFEIIRREIPVGQTCRQVPVETKMLEEHLDASVLKSGDAPSFSTSVWSHYGASKTPQNDVYRFYTNLGTLGGGNHFIELQQGSDGHLWIMIHSGSRKFGYECAKYYHDQAVKLNRKWKSAVPTEDLAFLPTEGEGEAFVNDLELSLKYALRNRKMMMGICFNILHEHLSRFDIEKLEAYDVHHNYAAPEFHYGTNVWVHRKGATRAREGEIGIIPGSMGAKSYIVKGLGNRESFHSCSHGAGRVMGRNEASKKLDAQEVCDSMEGIVYPEFRKNARLSKKHKKDVLDLGEAPQAYKNITEVIENQLDLIEPLVELTPLMVVKG